jgi:hypothetical protein
MTNFQSLENFGREDFQRLENQAAFRQADVMNFKHLVVVAAVLIMPVLASRGTTLVITANKIEAPGGWQLETGKKVVRDFIIANATAKSAPAACAIDVPHAGPWHLWVRSKDFPDYRPGTRTFSVRIGATKSKTVFGKHGRKEFDGWSWEDGGAFDLQAGPALIVIGDDVTPSARCDALVLTDSATYKPEGESFKLGKQPAKIVPLTVSEESQRAIVPGRIIASDEKALAMLESDSLRLTFHFARTATGTAVAMRAATKAGDHWEPCGGDDEGYQVLFRPKNSDPRINSSSVHPTWDTQFAPSFEVRAGKDSVNTRIDPATAPWFAGQCFPMRPVGVNKRDATTVDLTFPPTEAGQLAATWHLESKQTAAEVSLVFTPSKPGHFSIGYFAPLAVPPAETDFMLLPFMFHGHRFPEKPVAILSALTPTPMTLVNKSGVSCALIAEPRELPFEWASSSNSHYAFGLRNETGKAQPYLYTPVLGQPGSVSDGNVVHGSFRILFQRGDWYAAYRHAADVIFHLADYRRPATASLSDTALNLLDLMRNEKASGWDAKAKGPWNIESRNIVTQSSPLTYLSYYLLTGDEDFYRRFALPSLEFLLSRPGPHFAAEREIGEGYYIHQPMRGPGSFYGASVFASAFAMTQGRSAAFGSACLNDDGNVRAGHGGGHVQPFEDALALFEITHEKRWLDAAMEAADNYIASNITKLPSRDIGPLSFVNVTFIPDWEGLLHLYDATGERRFLDAANAGARWLVTTLWTQPQIPDGYTVIHPGGVFDNARHVWAFGDRLFRLGLYDGPFLSERVKLEPVQLPERHAPSWETSNVGLGLEQPCTYTRRGPHANILMSTWAPNLLRMANETHDDAYRIAARNATIGRFANYPGYYVDGMTDQYQRPDYPLAGPDVTCLYVHHIVPFAAYVLDYLFTDAEIRSDGEVKFPSTRQSGYVWFDNRLFGHAPGKVYGQTAWPWLHRTAATVDNIAVDRVLAHGDDKFHVALLNQTREPQQVRVTFDEKAIGRTVEGARVITHVENKTSEPLTIKDRAVNLELGPLGITVLTLDGCHIDIPTHRIAPPEKFSLPQKPGAQRVAIPDSKLEAIGTEIQVPPFAWRDLFVYVTASIDDCRAAILRYRIGDGPEKEIKDGSFPWEFSARIADMKSPVTWNVDVQMADGTWRKGIGPSGK